MANLTPRQTVILKAVVDEYIETAQPVGSETIDKKFSLGVSPATIRNEMTSLTSEGFLRQPHTSSGRVPTPLALRFYIDQLMEEKRPSLAEEVKAKEEVWDARRDLDHLMRETTRALARSTGALAVGATEEGDLWHAGYANLFTNPEFTPTVFSGVFEILDEYKKIHELFFEHITSGDLVEVVFGEELGWPNFEPISVVASRFQAGGQTGILGVIGPRRIPFYYVIPRVRYFRDLVCELLR